MLLIKGKAYDTLKYIAQIGLPAVGTLYFALSQIWGFGHGNEVVGSIVAIDAALGTMLHLSSQAYENSDAKYDGTVDVTETNDKKNFLLNVASDLDKLDQKKELRLKINPVTKPKVKRVSRKRTTAPKDEGRE